MTGRLAVDLANALSSRRGRLDIGLPGFDGYEVANDYGRAPSLTQ